QHDEHQLLPRPPEADRAQESAGHGAVAREPVRVDAEELRKRDGILQAPDQPRGRARQPAADLAGQPSSWRVSRRMSASSSASAARSFSIWRTAWITVVWSRPPKRRPMSGSDFGVSCFDRYIATWRGRATSRARRADVISALRMR